MRATLDKYYKMQQDIIRVNIMDPASLSNLDPKLRETYERVMGTTPAPTDPPPTTSDATTATTTSTPTDTMTASEPSTPETVPTPATPAENPAAVDPLAAPAADTTSSPEQQPQTVTITQSLPNPTIENQIAAPHGHMGLIKIFYVLGAIVFFVIYVFFWMKIFNISLPF